jgi:hypothetical protein
MKKLFALLLCWFLAVSPSFAECCFSYSPGTVSVEGTPALNDLIHYDGTKWSRLATPDDGSDDGGSLTRPQTMTLQVDTTLDQLYWSATITSPYLTQPIIGRAGVGTQVADGTIFLQPSGPSGAGIYRIDPQNAGGLRVIHVEDTGATDAAFVQKTAGASYTSGGVGYGNGSRLAFTAGPAGNGRILTSSGGVPVWSNTGATGGVAYGNSNALTWTAAPGNDNYVLQSSGGVPIWKAATATGGVAYGNSSGGLVYTAAPVSDGQILTSSGGVPVWGSAGGATTRIYGGWGGGTSLRALPTSGTLTGTYYHVGNWTSTGTITCNRCYIHVVGTFTLNHALTVNTELTGGLGTSAVAGLAGAGSGLGGGQPGSPANAAANQIVAGGGGGFGGAGGNGGSSITADVGGRGGRTYDILHQLCGSAGAGGAGSGAGGNGGAAGGGLYIETSGDIVINANITATGGAGGSTGVASGAAGGGGSGGGIDIRSAGTVTINATRQVTAIGGAGGDASSTTDAAGGGGGGGYIAIHGTTVTNNGTVSAVAGNAGTGNAGTATPTAGSTGVTLLESVVWPMRMTP